MQAKMWWESRTLWANAVMAAIAVLTTMLDTELVVQLATDYPWVLTGIVLLINALNMVLRLITGKPIEMPSVGKGLKIFLAAAAIIVPLGIAGNAFFGPKGIFLPEAVADTPARS